MYRECSRSVPLNNTPVYHFENFKVDFHVTRYKPKLRYSVEHCSYVYWSTHIFQCLVNVSIRYRVKFRGIVDEGDGHFLTKIHVVLTQSPQIMALSLQPRSYRKPACQYWRWLSEHDSKRSSSM